MKIESVYELLHLGWQMLGCEGMLSKKERNSSERPDRLQALGNIWSLSVWVWVFTYGYDLYQVLDHSRL